MPGFTLTSKAKSDLIEIAHHAQERWGLEQRNLYLRMLDECFRQLAAKPLQGGDCSEIRVGYRKLLAGRHVIFYRQSGGDKIEVVRILHGRMDVEAHLSGA